MKILIDQTVDEYRQILMIRIETLRPLVIKPTEWRVGNRGASSNSEAKHEFHQLSSLLESTFFEGPQAPESVLTENKQYQQALAEKIKAEKIKLRVDAALVQYKLNQRNAL